MLRGSGCYDLCALPHDPPECGGEHAVDFLWGKLETRPANYLFLLMQCNKKESFLTNVKVWPIQVGGKKKIKCGKAYR